HRRREPPQRHAATGRWGGVPRPRLAWWLCASALLLMAAGLLLLALSRHARFPPSMDSWEEQALVILEFLGAPILGGLIAARRPANIYGWLWCVIGVGVGLDAFARGYATFGLLGRPGGLPGAMVVAWATNFTWILGLGLLPLVLLLFPDGHLPTPRWRPLAWLILVLAVALPLEGAISPGSLQLFPFLDNPVGVTGGALGRLVEAFGQVGFQLFLGTLPAAALALALRFHRSRGVERQQLKWFAAAGLILVAVPVADTISPFGFDSNRLIELLSTWPLYVAIGQSWTAASTAAATTPRPPSRVRRPPVPAARPGRAVRRAPGGGRPDHGANLDIALAAAGAGALPAEPLANERGPPPIPRAEVLVSGAGCPSPWRGDVTRRVRHPHGVAVASGLPPSGLFPASPGWNQPGGGVVGR
ncbi:MAG: hypothetical protein ACJ75E_21045, partial [Actinomycetes bacterium]